MVETENIALEDIKHGDSFKGSEGFEVENDIEVLEVVKESDNDFDLNEDANHLDISEKNWHSSEYDLGNKSVNDITKGIENKWYTFVKNDKTGESEIEIQKENYPGIEEMEENFLEDALLIKDDAKKEKKFKCTTCVKHFKDHLCLIDHERIHAVKETLECPTCNSIFKTKAGLKKHERIHTGEVPYECRTCKKRFKQLQSLMQHERVHTGEKPYECEACETRFKQLGHLKAHERIHTGEMPFKCMTCKKRYKDGGTLKRHETIHTDEAPYECETCGKRFRLIVLLRSHEKIHNTETTLNTLLVVGGNRQSSTH